MNVVVDARCLPRFGIYRNENRHSHPRNRACHAAISDCRQNTTGSLSNNKSEQPACDNVIVARTRPAYDKTRSLWFSLAALLRESQAHGEVGTWQMSLRTH